MCKQHDVSGDVQHTVTWDREMGEMRRGQPGERGDWWAEFTGSARRAAVTALGVAEELPGIQQRKPPTGTPRSGCRAGW